MASEPQQPSETSQKGRLPFEKSKKRQKPAKTKVTSGLPRVKPETIADKTANKSEKQRFTKEEMAIPKVVSDRMVRRMALFCGIPTALGIATFVVSYFVIIQGWFKLPTIAVLLTSMGCLGLGVLGLSYGVLSASWDEEIAGSKLGWKEFTANWGRMVSAWRSTRQKNV